MPQPPANTSRQWFPHTRFAATWTSRPALGVRATAALLCALALSLSLPQLSAADTLEVCETGCLYKTIVAALAQRLSPATSFG